MDKQALDTSFVAKGLAISEDYLGQILRGSYEFQDHHIVALCPILGRTYDEIKVYEMNWADHTLRYLLNDDIALEVFLEAPLDPTHRKWVKKSLSIILKRIEAKLPELVELRQRQYLWNKDERLEAREAKKAKEKREYDARRMEIDRRQLLIEQAAKAKGWEDQTA